MFSLASFISDKYFSIFSRKELARYNDFILSCAIRARGFNNFSNAKVSGEKYFVERVLSRLSPKICVDVGANVGNYTRLLLEKTSAQVFSFEPLPIQYAALSELNKKFGHRLVPINKGVGAKCETLDIHFSEDATEHASFSLEVKNVPYVRNNLVHKAEVVTLDSFFQNRPDVPSIDFLKIDTEGFEYEVLLGASETLTKLSPWMIQIEYNLHQLFKSQSLYNFSKLLPAYRLFQLLPDRLIKREPEDPYANVYQFSNFVFVRADFEDQIGTGAK